MRYLKLIFCLLLFASSSSRGQVNYVLNPDFETYTGCPYQFDQIGFATYWGTIDSTFDNINGLMDTNNICRPEYIHTCATSYLTSAPENQLFYQYPRSGQGMAEVMTLFNESYSGAYHRDYLQGRLKAPLQAGHNYCVTFYVCLEDASRMMHNKIGAYLDDGSIDTNTVCGYGLTNYGPQVFTNDIISDSINWTKIEGSFTADGTERFITIGNFFTNTNTSFVELTEPVNLQSNHTWYLVDDVSVVESNTVANAGNDTVIIEGDSAFIGLHETLPECVWYEGATPIGSTAGMYVHPTTTTTYILQQAICSVVTYDTVTVTVWPTSVNGVNNDAFLRIYPNPASTELTIMSSDKISSVSIVDVTGRVVLQRTVNSEQITVDVSGLSSGVYFVRVGGSVVKFVRE